MTLKIMFPISRGSQVVHSQPCHHQGEKGREIKPKQPVSGMSLICKTCILCTSFWSSLHLPGRTESNTWTAWTSWSFSLALFSLFPGWSSFCLVRNLPFPQLPAYPVGGQLCSVLRKPQNISFFLKKLKISSFLLAATSESCGTGKGCLCGLPFSILILWPLFVARCPTAWWTAWPSALSQKLEGP